MTPLAAWARRLVAVLALVLGWPLSCEAHKPSDAYLQLRVDGARVEQRFDVALRDLDRDLALDADENGLLDWREVRSRWADIEALAAPAVVVSADGRPCSAGPTGTPLLDDHSDGRYAVLTRRWTCSQPVQRLRVAYGLFAQTDPSHRGIVRVLAGAAADVGGGGVGVGETAVLTPAGPPRDFALAGSGGGVASAGTGAAASGGTAVAGGGGAGAAAGGWLSGFLGFVPEGVHHILIGSDHILFLLALLLPALLVRARPSARPGFAGGLPTDGGSTGGGHGGMGGMGRGDLGGAGAGRGSAPLQTAAVPVVARMPAVAWPVRAPATVSASTATAAAAVPASSAPRPATAGWLPAPSLRPVLADVLRVVTAFTVAHSITLALAAFDVLNPPSRLVESVIAASVVLAALNNLFPVFREGRWKLTFVFGLVHGFGFASALKDIGLTQGALVGPLLGFNVGVELGQLAIVAVFITVAWKLRTTRFYVRGLLTVGSVAIALLALGWLVERAFDVKLPLPL